MNSSKNATAPWGNVSGSSEYSGGVLHKGHILLNLLYPRTCPVCHEILEDQKSLACPECLRRLRPIPEPRCLLCGYPLENGESLCGACKKHPHAFDGGRAVFAYDEDWKLSIEKFKYYGARDYGRFFAWCIFRAGKDAIKSWRPDRIAAVPLHPRKKRQRGFNQSWELARHLSGYTGIPAEEGLVVKERETQSQKKLSAAERRRNLVSAYRVSRPLRGERILVVDDVYTTGSTMDAMAEVLKKAGASAVFFVTLCMGIR